MPQRARREGKTGDELLGSGPAPAGLGSGWAGPARVRHGLDWADLASASPPKVFFSRTRDSAFFKKT